MVLSGSPSMSCGTHNCEQYDEISLDNLTSLSLFSPLSRQLVLSSCSPSRCSDQFCHFQEGCRTSGL